MLAHRGANRVAPENTVAAMRAAVERGADGVELDVHRSADGALVVRHDATTPAGAVGQLTVAQLREAEPHLPVLAEALDVCRGLLVNVEIKDPDPQVVDGVVELLAGRTAAGADDVLVSSFALETVDRVRELAPALPTGFLSFGLDPNTALLLAYERGHGAVHPDVWTLTMVDCAEFVVRAHDLGLRVNVWTVNDAAQLESLAAAGVDAVITDDDDLYRFGAGGLAIRG